MELPTRYRRVLVILFDCHNAQYALILEIIWNVATYAFLFIVGLLYCGLLLTIGNGRGNE